MQIIPDVKGENNTSNPLHDVLPLILDRRFRFDTLEIYTTKDLKQREHLLNDTCTVSAHCFNNKYRPSYWPKNRRFVLHWKYNPYQIYRTDLSSPTHTTFDRMMEYLGSRAFESVVTVAHPCVDFITESVENAHVVARRIVSLVKKAREQDHLVEFLGTAYSGRRRKVSNGKSKKTRKSIWVIYVDHDKITNRSCCHVEYRVQTHKHVEKELGIRTLQDLKEFNFIEFFVKNLTLLTPTQQTWVSLGRAMLGLKQWHRTVDHKLDVDKAGYFAYRILLEDSDSIPVSTLCRRAKMVFDVNITPTLKSVFEVGVLFGVENGLEAHRYLLETSID